MAALPWLVLPWLVVNDTVMGGVSTGRVEVSDRVRFAGELSLERSGGFVSIRTVDDDLDLDGVRALRVTVAGDPRTWDLTLRRSDVPLRGGSYRVRIPVSETPTVVEVPLADFRPTAFGRPVLGLPSLDAAPERIVSIGFLLADRSPGPFTLEVSAIEAVMDAPARGPGHGQVAASLRAALAEGVPAFNAGDPARCRDVYVEVLRRHVDHPALTAGERSIARDALARVGAVAPSEGAWVARHAIDTLLASAP